MRDLEADYADVEQVYLAINRKVGWLTWNRQSHGTSCSEYVGCSNARWYCVRSTREKQRAKQTTKVMAYQSQTTAIIGVGLIGGSLARAMKDRSVAEQIIGCGRDESRLAAAQQRGLIDEWTTDLAEAGARADFVVVCTPVDRIAGHVSRCAIEASPDTLITDAGSVKGPICDAVDVKSATFIGSHPIAGSEKQGFEHERGDLFDGHVCVVTPDATTPSNQLERLQSIWQAVGCRVITMSPAEHDHALAQTSHLEHLLASALTLTVDESMKDFVGTGFGGMTRIADGSPDVWTPILSMNQHSVLQNLGRLQDQLRMFHDALEGDDEAQLTELLAAAKLRREQLAPPNP